MSHDSPRYRLTRPVDQTDHILGPDGAEIHKPVLENRPRHRFERFVHPAVEVDFVVECAKDGDYSALLFNRRYWNK